MTLFSYAIQWEEIQSGYLEWLCSRQDLSYKVCDPLSTTVYGRHGDQLGPRHSSSSVIGDEQLRSPSSGETQEPEQEMIETSRVG